MLHRLSMSMYYLHRHGETTGPYAPGRLGMMLDAGEIAATDQACEIGTEEWMPVEFVLPERDVARWAPEPTYGLKTSRQPWAFLSFILCLIAVLGFFSWGLGRVGGIGAFVSLLLIIIGVALDRPKWLCGECGNRIEKTSGLCPVCKATLVFKLPKKK
jgi:hypothetical protein